MCESEPGFTVAENDLLNRLATGELDCVVDGDRYFWLAIRNGIPTQFMENSSRKRVVNGEIERALGDVRIYREWKTEEEKLDFLREYGSKIDDLDVQAYAAKEEKPQEKPKRKLILPLREDMFRRVYSFDLGVRTLS